MMTKKTRFSLHNFFGFLEAVWQEKLVKKNTLKRWQDAIAEFQQVLGDEEVADLRRVDVKRLGARYVDLLVDTRSSVTPWRIYHLKNAFAQAIGDFVAFTVNPHEYKRTTSLALAKQIYLHNTAHSTGAAVVALPTHHGTAKWSAVAR
jgi:site-specific recombinase XerD